MFSFGGDLNCYMIQLSNFKKFVDFERCSFKAVIFDYTIWLIISETQCSSTDPLGLPKKLMNLLRGIIMYDLHDESSVLLISWLIFRELIRMMWL